MLAQRDLQPHRPTVSLEVPVRQIEDHDLDLCAGDRHALVLHLEPFAESLREQPLHVVRALIDSLYPYYIAGTLAHLSRMLPSTAQRFKQRRAGTSSTGMLGPDQAIMHTDPRVALHEWVSRYRQVGGTLMIEAHAIYRQITIVEVLQAHRIPVPPHALPATPYPEQLPDHRWLLWLIEMQSPPGYYWSDEQVAIREEELRQEFEAHWLRYIVRLLRVVQPDAANAIAERLASYGMGMALSLIRLSLPMRTLRRHRLEALAFFPELATPMPDQRPVWY